MPRRILMLAAALAVAVVSVGAGTASAATLYTTSAHTTPVPINTTFTATTPSFAGSYLWEFPVGNPWMYCTTVVYSFKVTQNSGGVFKADSQFAGTTYSGCAASLTQGALAHLQIAGSATTLGTGKAWLGTTLNNVVVQVAGIPGSFTGNFAGATGSPPVNGISAQQPAAAAPVALVVDKAGPLTGVNSAYVSTKYTLTGTAASYSLG